MILIINGWMTETTNFKPSEKDNKYYNVEVKLVALPSMKLRFNHKQFYKENPEYIQALQKIYKK
jgi:hypothetical protein